MAILFQASNDFIATADLDLFYTGYSGSTLSSSAPALIGNRLAAGNAIWKKVHATGVTTLWVQFHVLFTTIAAQSYSFFVVGNDTRTNAGLALAAGVIKGTRQTSESWGNGMGYIEASLGEGSVPISANTWYSIACEIVIGDSDGIIKTWINGEADLTLTGVDTRQGTNSTPITTVGFVGSRPQYTYFDNIVIGDTSSPHTASPGECRVDAMMPNANGTYRATGGTGEMTRSNTGVDEYTLLDETAASANTSDYIYADAVGELCSLNVAALTNSGGTISAVTATAYATKNEPGPCGFKIFCLSGGTKYYSDEFFPSWGSWNFFQKIWQYHPNPSDEAWTEADYNACEFGIERTT